MTIGVYAISHKNLPDCKYIGSSKNCELRWKCHKRRARSPDFLTRRLYNTLRWYGVDCFQFEILEEVDEYVPLSLREKEQCYISMLQPKLNQKKSYISAEEQHEKRLAYWRKRSKTPIPCECGCIIRKSSKSTHKKCTKHLERMKRLENLDNQMSNINKELQKLNFLPIKRGNVVGLYSDCAGNIVPLLQLTPLTDISPTLTS